MHALRFGIEIETVRLPRDQIAQALQGVVGGRIIADGYGSRHDQVVSASDGRQWSVVHDGSLSHSASGEIVSPILTYADIPMLQDVVRAVRREGARVDRSCGIHVHIDGSRFDAKSIANLVKIIHKQERLIENSLGIQPGRLQRYCQPIDPTFLAHIEQQRPRSVEQVREAWYGYRGAVANRYNVSRYRGVNLNSFFYRGTIEFRLFEGSLHAGEVKSYVQFCLAIAAKALRAKRAVSERRQVDEAGSRYQMRTFLLSLGMIGPEFKTARHHLTMRLTGSTAWKGERRDRRENSYA